MEILKLMNDSKANMLDLLDAICKANPPDIDDKDSVLMSCPRHPDSHPISRSCFLLLENIEAAFGTTEQTVELISLGNRIHRNSFVAALATRLTRQQKQVTSISL